MSVTLLALSLMGAAAPAAATPAAAAAEPMLAADILVAGRHGEAIKRLERELSFEPWNPALLINLGVAYAEAGDVARAREALRDAAGASRPMQVVTLDGTQTDTWTVARRGLRILARGGVAMDARTRGQLTLRD